VLKKPGEMMQIRASKGIFPEPLIHSFTSVVGTMSVPANPHTDRMKRKKNPAYQIARFAVYPSCRILLAVLAQKFPAIVIINK
jgi:hypothetical protein